jgi:methyl-accepting chemotaxis protein
MEAILTKLSLRTLLYLIAVAPLIAFLSLAGMSVYKSFTDYQQLRGEMVVQKLASTGGRVAQALPAEAFASAEQRPARRKVVDDVLAELQADYANWQATGNADPAVDKAFGLIMEKQKLIGTYRAHVDAGQFDPNEALFILQPASGAGLELVRRSAATINDLALSRFIAGFHALMEVNDAGLIDIRLGQSYLSGRALSPGEFSFLLHAKGLREQFGPQFMEFLSADLVAPIKAFYASEDGAFLDAMRQKMYSEAPKTPDEAGLDRWTKVTGAQAGLMAGTIAKAGMALAAEAQGRLDALRWMFIQTAIVAALVSAAVISLCFVVVRSVSRMIRSIENRMHGLAEGDRNSVIPFSERTDEIGGIARSVAVFRQAAIRNAELEAQTEENRRRAEAERLEVQRAAEADAEARLNKMTSTFAAALHRLASGDMLCEIKEEFGPQFEQLRQDFNVSIGHLRNVLLSVGQAASAVSGGSGEISHASDDLARRTEHQAASLEETAAALEEITANVHATSKRTVEARDLVRNARNRAEHSGVVVGNAVTAMGRIEHASRQISHIITVIDEIAFQTNLLALNAGVEAARAGDAGKGFAVVAQEVRELAQRSANAAKEIKTLIGNSETAVSEGVRLVHDTGDGLSTIADLVLQINGHMDAIAAAAEEQAVGLGEVNSAVTHMDQSTQQNAAMVEEMNAASAGLAEEASGLATLLGQFRTEEALRAGSRVRAA